MKGSQIFWILFIGLFLGACSQETPIDVKRDSGHNEVSNKISLEEALSNANALFSQLEGSTRAKERRVSSVAYLGSTQNTRSTADNDTMYYLVNYAEDSGFAVLSANKEIGEVFAIAPEGNLAVEDTVDNRGLAYFFRGLNSLTQTYNASQVITPSKPFNPFDSIANIEGFRLPKLNGNVKCWPGNKLSPLYGKYANISISISQAMTYFKKPSIWTSWYYPNEKRTMNWELINSYKFSSSSQITDPGVVEIEALISAVEETLIPNGDYFFYEDMEHFGGTYGYEIGQLYTSAEDGCGHEHQEPLSSKAADWRKALNEDRIIVSMADFGLYWTNVTEMVSWVVDGYVKYKEGTCSVLVPYNADTLFHCVWGRGSTCNGYFAFMSDTEYFVPTPIAKDIDLNYNMPLDSNVRPLHYTFKAN
ncbi:MAG: hypothetical protein HDR88_18140 [Bacteroides sp.]|nr:hypothetical protein [Bacteroides sp.]